MMKFFIRADGSEKIGTGHIFRTLALARQLKAQDHTVTYLCRPLIAALRQRLMKEKLEIQDIPDTQPFNSEMDVVLDILEKQNPQWMIVDHYDVQKEYYGRLRVHGRKVLAIDDINQTHFPVDILLNQNIYADQIFYSCATFTKRLNGPEYALMDEAYSQKRNTAQVRTSLKRVLIFMGGADLNNLTLKMLRAVASLEKSLEVDIVLGSAYLFDEELLKASGSSRIKVNIYKDIPSLADLILSADLAICAGGSTCWQMCVLFLPMLIVSVADNQIKIAEGIAKTGAAIDLGVGIEVTQEKIVQIISALKDSDIESMSEKAGTICDGRGVQRLIAQLEGKASS